MWLQRPELSEQLRSALIIILIINTVYGDVMVSAISVEGLLDNPGNVRSEDIRYKGLNGRSVVSLYIRYKHMS
jgi:hypothetical protein